MWGYMGGEEMNCQQQRDLNQKKIEELRSKKECTSFQCVNNTGKLNNGKIHLGGIDYKCILDNPGRVEERDYWYCTDERHPGDIRQA
jgi:hypothetical protein